MGPDVDDIERWWRQGLYEGSTKRDIGVLLRALGRIEG